nr:S-layer homology domain-containing protein [Caldalkalibacillus salinus]
MSALAINDAQGHWAEDTINAMTESGHINGYEDGTFRPNNSITRAEFTMVVTSVLGLDSVEGSTSFSDVSSQHWASGAINASVNEDIINGYENGTFRPSNNITRAEIATMAVRALIQEETFEVPQAELEFTDANNIPDWAQPYIAYAVSEGLIQGYPDGSFKPSGGATRAEAVVILSRVEESIDNSGGGGGVVTPPSDDEDDDDSSPPAGGGGGTPGGPGGDNGSEYSEYPKSFGQVLDQEVVTHDVYGHLEFEVATALGTESVHLLVKPQEGFEGIELKIKNSDETTVKEAVYDETNKLDEEGWFVLEVSDEKVSPTITVTASVYGYPNPSQEVGSEEDDEKELVYNKYEEAVDLTDGQIFNSLDIDVETEYTVTEETYTPEVTLKQAYLLVNEKAGLFNYKLASEDFTLQTDDDEVIKISEDKPWSFKPAGAGEATLKITYGNLEESIEITVNEGVDTDNPDDESGEENVDDE